MEQHDLADGCVEAFVERIRPYVTQVLRVQLVPALPHNVIAFDARSRDRLLAGDAAFEALRKAGMEACDATDG
jgi:hypothetical protein